MDSGDLEREKGITILAKNTSVSGRASRSTSSTHRVTPTSVARSSGRSPWSMASCSWSTRPRVRSRRLASCSARRSARDLPVILVINKVDRPDARIAEVVNEVYELFLDIDARDDQIDFPIVYCAARDGWASLDEDVKGENLEPLFQLMVDHDPAPGLRRGPPAAGLGHQPRLLALSRAPGAVSGDERHPHQGASPSRLSRVDGSIQRVKLSELYLTEAPRRVCRPTRPAPAIWWPWPASTTS